MLTPQPPRRRRSQQGFGQPNIRTTGQPHGPLLRSAQAAQREALAPAIWGRAQRSEAMARVDVRSRGFPSGCAEERSGQRIRARDCLSAVKRSEFERDPAGREHRRLPAAKRRDAACRVAFSLVTFSWRSKRKLLRRRAHTPASALQPGMRPDQRACVPWLRQAQPERFGDVPWLRQMSRFRHAQPERAAEPIRPRQAQPESPTAWKMLQN